MIGAVMQMSLMTPPVFDSAEWPDEPRAPYLYKGLDSDLVMEQIKPVSETWAELLGTLVEVTGAFFERPEGDQRDPNHPVYFEVTGRKYQYRVSIWADRTVIEVCNNKTSRRLSAMFPETEAQLRQALATVVADYSKR